MKLSTIGLTQGLHLAPRFAANVYRAAVALSLTAAASGCFAQDAMLRLVPADAPVLVGMRRTSDTTTERVWLATHADIEDLNDLVAMTATDSARRFDRVVASASPAGSDLLGEHLLLAEGRFHFEDLRLEASASVANFEGVPVLVVPSTSGGGTRWLAVLDSRIAVFGSPAAVKKALLRYTHKAALDPALIQRLKRIPGDDVAWSSITLDPVSLRARLNLHGYEHTVAPCLANASELNFGIRFDSRAKVDLHMVTGSQQEAADASACLHQLAQPEEPIAMRVTLSSDPREVNLSFAATRDRYNQWIARFRTPFASQLLASVARPAGVPTGQ